MTYDHSENTSIILEAINQNLTVSVPKIFTDLLNCTLTGWSLLPNTNSKQADITVTHHNNQFIFETILAKSVPSHTDLIDTLNELFLCIAYIVTNKIRGAKLLHCAAFKDNDENVIIFGRKKAGKSSLALKKVQSDAILFADDLLLWIPRSAQFICLGLPIRMRRPIHNINENIPQFIAGKQTAYAHKNAFRVAEAGFTFTPDQILLIDCNEIIPMSLLKWPKLIAQYTISDDFTEILEI